MLLLHEIVYIFDQVSCGFNISKLYDGDEFDRCCLGYAAGPLDLFRWCQEADEGGDKIGNI